MSTSGATTAPMANARVYCEPFVYTSMATKFSSSGGYRMVASGEKLSRQASDAVNDMSQRMVLLTQAVDPSHELFAYFTTGGALPLVVFLRCTANLDWQGRPGGFCSALAFRRDELAQLPGASPHALDIGALPFLTQDQIVSFLKSAGDQGRDGLVLKGLQLKPAVPGYFRPGDRAHLAANLPQYLGLARRFEGDEILHVRKDEDTWRTLRLVSLLLPAAHRADTSAMLGARRGLERVGRVQIWLEGAPGAANPTSLLSKAADAGDPAFMAYLAEALNNPAVSDEQIIALLTPDPSIESVKEFWADVRQGQHRQELARSRSLKGRPAAETAATLASLIRRGPDRAAFVAERFEAWRGEPELLAGVLQAMRVSHADAYKLAVAAMGEAVAADPAGQLRAVLAQTSVWRTPVLRDFWLAAWAEVAMPLPDEELLGRVLALDDASARAWLERWVPHYPAFFLAVKAFRGSALWPTLSTETRRALYRACLEAADAELRQLAVKNAALNEFIAPSELELLDPAAFGDARGFVHRFEQRHSPMETFALWQAAAALPGYDAVAKMALWGAIDVLPKLTPEARLAVLRVARDDPQRGPTSLHYRASQMLEKLRFEDAAAFEAAAREFTGAEPAPAPPHQPAPPAPAWAEGMASPPRARRSKAPLIIGLAAVLVLGGGIGAFLALRPKPAPAADRFVAERELEGYKGRPN